MFFSLKQMVTQTKGNVRAIAEAQLSLRAEPGAIPPGKRRENGTQGPAREVRREPENGSSKAKE